MSKNLDLLLGGRGELLKLFHVLLSCVDQMQEGRAITFKLKGAERLQVQSREE